jgi:hypothetical protein
MKFGLVVTQINVLWNLLNHEHDQIYMSHQYGVKLCPCNTVNFRGGIVYVLHDTLAVILWKLIKYTQAFNSSLCLTYFSFLLHEIDIIVM